MIKLLKTINFIFLTFFLCLHAYSAEEYYLEVLESKNELRPGDFSVLRISAKTSQSIPLDVEGTKIDDIFYVLKQKDDVLNVVVTSLKENTKNKNDEKTDQGNDKFFYTNFKYVDDREMPKGQLDYIKINYEDEIERDFKFIVYFIISVLLILLISPFFIKLIKRASKRRKLKKQIHRIKRFDKLDEIYKVYNIKENIKANMDFDESAFNHFQKIYQHHVYKKKIENEDLIKIKNAYQAWVDSLRFK